MVDKELCMSYYLAFRYIPDNALNFFESTRHCNSSFTPPWNRKVKTADEMAEVIQRVFAERGCTPEKTAVLLSGGMDSACLAAFCPKGTKVYTFSPENTDARSEVEQAAKYAKQYGLEHHLVTIGWKDFEELTPVILKAKQAPVHSIEIQILKAAMIAKANGAEQMIIGESADLIFGGMDRILSRDWKYDDFVRFYTFLPPERVLKEPRSVNDVYEPYRRGTDDIDFLSFQDDIFSHESSNSYINAFAVAGLEAIDPYVYMSPAEPLDLERIRNGEPKYMVRSLFAKCYPEIPIPFKIPMPRPTEQFFANWQGPTRPEFLPDCVSGLTGDQKWQCWCLEQFLNMHDKGEV